MHRCRVGRELSSYLDNQLEPRSRRKVEAHLEGCSVCAQELAQLRALGERLKTWQVAETGQEFDNTVRNAIVAREIEGGRVVMKSRTKLILIPSGVIAGILVFLFAGQGYLKRGLQGTLRESSERKDAAYSSRYAPSKLKNSSRIVRGYLGQPSTGDLVEDARLLGGAFPFPSVKMEEGMIRNSLEMSADYTSAPGAFGKRENLKRGSLKEDAASSGGAKVNASGYEGAIIIVEPVLPATGEGDKIIRSADVRLEVENGRETYRQAVGICQEFGGYVAGSKFYKDREGREAGTITMRIPQDKFTVVLDRLAALGSVEHIDTASRDVRQEYANLKSELDAAMVVYNKMREALEKRQVTIPDAVRLESELTPVLKRIAGLKNQIEYLDNTVSFTTVNVAFHESAISAKVLKDSRRYIRESWYAMGINGIKLTADILPFIPGLAAAAGFCIGLVCVIMWIIGKYRRRG